MNNLLEVILERDKERDARRTLWYVSGERQSHSPKLPQPFGETYFWLTAVLLLLDVPKVRLRRRALQLAKNRLPNCSYYSVTDPKLLRSRCFFFLTVRVSTARSQNHLRPCISGDFAIYPKSYSGFCVIRIVFMKGRQIGSHGI